MTPACLGEVTGGELDEWTVQPFIVEDDGTDHPEIVCTQRDGMTPAVGDTVLIEFMRNNLDFESVKRFYKSSESNGVIIGIMETDEDTYVLTGNYKFVGNLTVEDGDIECSGDITADGDIVAAGISLKNHTHPPGTYAAGGDPVTGASGTPT